MCIMQMKRCPLPAAEATPLSRTDAASLSVYGRSHRRNLQPYARYIFWRDAHAVPNATACTITEWIPRRSRMSPADRAEFRRRVGISRRMHCVLLFAGRLVPEKNPVFAVDVLANLRRIRAASCAASSPAPDLRSQNVLGACAELGVERFRALARLAKRSCPRS